MAGMRHKQQALAQGVQGEYTRTAHHSAPPTTQAAACARPANGASGQRHSQVPLAVL